MRVSSQIFVTEEYTDGSSKIQMIVDILSGWSFGILEPWNFMTFHIKKYCECHHPKHQTVMIFMP